MGRKVDISELYDILRANPESYVLCCDVERLMPINETFGHGAGDCVIREAFRRIDAAAGDSMTAFRIGGDEFALVTGLSDPEQVRAIGEGLLAQNGGTIEFEGNTIPVGLHIGAIKLASEHLRYSELFNRLDSTIRGIHEPENADTEVLFVE